ncbi:MAG: phosphoenolpyruvate--protein phosphotransferase [Planctomycetota bacterium]|nr:MAG: phosphoenolpyruvate--protein phosphotransferase [Planctomycetota bacterium]
MEVLKGIAVSPGLVIGPAFVLDDAPLRVRRRTIGSDRIRDEVQRLEEALTAARTELDALRAQAAQEFGKEAAQVFAFHVGLLSDPSLTEPMKRRIEQEGVSAEYAASVGFQELAQRLRSLGDEAFRTKVDDVWDLDRRVLSRLIGQRESRIDQLDEPSIVAAPDLTPSTALKLHDANVLGFATEAGGLTSHTAILARALGLPAVVGLPSLTRVVEDGATVILDGDRGVVIVHPDAQTLEEHQQRIKQLRRIRVALLEEGAEAPSITRDGQPVAILGNIEFPEEIDDLNRYGGQGVGLFRTEFLYLRRRTDPSEEEQLAAYLDCLRRLDGKPLHIRTLDLGADKPAPGEPAALERNPALGCRSIRRSLQNLPSFKKQLRAVLRASAHGDVRLMFPLITNTLEIRQARMVLRDVMEDLEEEGVPFNRDLPVGMMVETPAAAITASLFAREVDFFSIGTNDLVQYTLAVDRTNERVANLYSAAHPAVLKLIKDVIRAGRRRGISVSICGEAAGQLEYTMLLIGMGLRTLSVTPTLAPRVKQVVRRVDVRQCERLARKVGSFDSERQITAYLREQTRMVIPEVFDGRSVD